MVDSADVQRIDEAADELVRPALRVRVRVSRLVRVRVSRLVEVVGEEREVGHRLQGDMGRYRGRYRGGIGRYRGDAGEPGPGRRWWGWVGG